MKIFKINDNIEVVCQSERTRYGFRHLATLIINGIEREKGKRCYYNRTWEIYEYQSVLYDVIAKAFKNKIISEHDRDFCNEFIKEGKQAKKQAKEELQKEFRIISMVASLGNVFCNTDKEKNDWKIRMLKAGLENSGLSIPEDWDTLTEEEKTKRLDGVIQTMKEGD